MNSDRQHRPPAQGSVSSYGSPSPSSAQVQPHGETAGEPGSQHGKRMESLSPDSSSSHRAACAGKEPRGRVMGAGGLPAAEKGRVVAARLLFKSSCSCTWRRAGTGPCLSAVPLTWGPSRADLGRKLSHVVSEALRKAGWADLGAATWANTLWPPQGWLSSQGGLWGPHTGDSAKHPGHSAKAPGGPGPPALRILPKAVHSDRPGFYPDSDCSSSVTLGPSLSP